MKGSGGDPRVQRMGIRQVCPLSPILFGILLDVQIELMSSVAPESGVLLGCGCRVHFMCYADHVNILSDDSQGLQHLIDSMQGFCVSVDLVISVSTTKFVVFHGPHFRASWSL